MGDVRTARDEANFILSKSPADAEAPLLLAEASFRPQDIADARNLISQLPNMPDGNAGGNTALGYLDLKQKNLGEAEVSLKKALAIDPKSSAAYSCLGVLYRMKDDVGQADQALASAYKTAQARSPTRLNYPQFKIQSGDVTEGRRLLEEVVHDAPDYIPALILLAELDLSQKKYPEAESAIGKALQRDASHPEAMLLAAQIAGAKGDNKKAVADLERIRELFPKSMQVHFLLGKAYLATGDITKAVSSLQKAVSINPNSTEALLLLAGTDIKKGDYKIASDALLEFLRKHPDQPHALLLEAQALRGQSDFDGALSVYRHLEISRPKDPEMPLFTGMMLLELNRREEARESFATSLRISPAYFSATEQLVNMDLAEHKYSAALQRASGEIGREPKSELPRLILAKVYLAQNDKADAETALLKAIELKPDSPAAYFLLAQLYVSTNRNEKALEDLKEVQAKNPKDIRSLMMMGVIYELRKNYTGARDAYEKVLAIDPTFTSAMNNLAYLYSENLNELDKGFELAQKARELQPNEPHMADTLGWILYKKHQYTWALGLLQESAGNLPTEAEVQFHLGMIHYMMGEEDQATAALQHSLQIDGKFEGSDEARQRLSTLAIDAGKVSEADMASLRNSLEGKADDPVALTRLAALNERAGANDKAAGELESALKINPANVGTMLKLVRLYIAEHETQKALDLAKNAHKLAPNDPAVSYSLSRLALQTGDYQWAYSLLQETLLSNADDPNLLYDFATASFCIGKPAEAQDAMKHAISSGVTGAKATEGAQFVRMLALADGKSPSASDVAAVESLLNENPKNGAALYALASIKEQNRESDAAITSYETLLREYPDFSPAKKQLAIIYSDDPGKDARTSELAVSAQEAFPSDGELAKVLGILAYRKLNFALALSLLQEAAGTRKDDAVLLYYLGMSQVELKNTAAARTSLQRALDIGLNPYMSGKAKSALADIK
jgi:tetratricopeptide (TPR) repeat protein